MNNIPFSGYSHFISLGYFCSVAMDLERFGLRDSSYPFDWCLSDFEGVISLIKNNFKDFLNYDDLSQNSEYLYRYSNKNGIEFVHDFDGYVSLKKQIEKVQNKYSRRIDNFYISIKEPTLFFRYISDEVCDENGKSKELIWIENHELEIENLLKSFNQENRIIYIANNEVVSDIIDIYHVKKYENVCWKPFEDNKDLFDWITNVEYDKKAENLKFYDEKVKRKNSFKNKHIIKNIERIKRHTLKEYVHDKQYDKIN